MICLKLNNIAGPDETGYIKAAAEITEWLAKGSLQDVLPSNMHPILQKLALSGHSRGGKAAFALALSKVASSALKLSALIGIDPVNRTTLGKTSPVVLAGVPFDLDGTPVMVIGSGLGAIKKNFLSSPCAPKGVNHENFYNECRSPACYFVITEQGHMDMLDNETKGIAGMLTYTLCKNGKSREAVRRFVAGALVAFLQAY